MVAEDGSCGLVPKGCSAQNYQIQKGDGNETERLDFPEGNPLVGSGHFKA